MPTIYCPTCGTGLKYLYSKPDSCSSCQSSLAPTISKASALPSEREDSETPRIFKKHKTLAKLNVVIDTVHLETLGEVLGSNPEERRHKRAPVSQQEHKSKIFKPAPLSIEND